MPTAIAIRLNTRRATAIGLLLALGAPAPLLAAEVSIFTRSGTVTDTAAGQASVSIQRRDEQALGAANERPGFAGVASTTAAQSRQDDPFSQPSDLIPQTTTRAGFSDVFFHRLGSSPDLGNGTYRLTFGIQIGGATAASQSPAPNNVPMSAQSGYSYRFAVGTVALEGEFVQSTNNGQSDIFTSGLGGGGNFAVQRIIHLGDFTTVAGRVGGFTSAAAYGLGSASSSLSAEARWMGVTRVEYDAGGGNFVEAPSGFRLDLTSDTTGFDYWGAAAGAAGAVPEPASWALLIIGFGAVGAMMRRRRTVPAAA